MSNIGYKPVKDAIVATLTPLMRDYLQVIYGKDEKKLEKYPAVTVSSKGHEAQLHDTSANLKTYAHFIRLYFRTDEKNDPDYEDILTITADAVIAALEHDLTLGGVCDWSLPTSGTWRNTEKESPVRMLEITLQTRARVVR